MSSSSIPELVRDERRKTDESKSSSIEVRPVARRKDDEVSRSEESRRSNREVRPIDDEMEVRLNESSEIPSLYFCEVLDEEVLLKEERE